MKKLNVLWIALFSAAFGFLSLNDSVKFNNFMSSELRSASGSIPGKTGAPNEPGAGNGNCTDCHSGSVQDGSNVNILTVMDGVTSVTSYVPGNTYSVKLVLNDQDVKEGFQATVLDGTETMAGSFPGTGATGTAINTFSGRDYVNHTSASNTNANVEWIWDWTAPATDVGTVTFYVASNIANGNGTNSGDVIYLSQHNITADAGGVGIEETEEPIVSIGYNPSIHSLIIDYIGMSINDIYVNVVDMNGRSVFTAGNLESKIGNDQKVIHLPGDINEGIYVVNFFVGNTPTSKKVYIK